MRLAEAAVLVTGATGGIGVALATALSRRGCRLALSGRRPDALEAAAAACAAAGSPGVSVHPGDLTDPKVAAGVVAAAWQAHGGLDAVVNNAGVPKRRHVTRLTPGEVEETLRANVGPAVAVSLAVLPRMLDRGQGVIVTVGSIAGRLGPPGEAAYAASKFALCGFAESMAVDLAGTGVRVRLVQPGAIDTPLWDDRPGDDPPVYTGPRLPPEAVAEAVVAALTEPGFERYVPPELAGVVAFKTGDVDAYLDGAAAVAAGAPVPDVSSPPGSH